MITMTDETKSALRERIENAVEPGEEETRAYLEQEREILIELRSSLERQALNALGERIWEYGDFENSLTPDKARETFAHFQDRVVVITSAITRVEKLPDEQITWVIGLLEEHRVKSDTRLTASSRLASWHGERNLTHKARAHAQDAEASRIRRDTLMGVIELLRRDEA